MNENYFKTISVRIFYIKTKLQAHRRPSILYIYSIFYIYIYSMYYNLTGSDVKAREYANGMLFS